VLVPDAIKCWPGSPVVAHKEGSPSCDTGTETRPTRRGRLHAPWLRGRAWTLCSCELLLWWIVSVPVPDAIKCWLRSLVIR
jgi:hypothetical protein